MKDVGAEAVVSAGRGAVKPSHVAQFFIPATSSLQERRPRTLKHGDTFAPFDHNRDSLAGPGGSRGALSPRYSPSVASVFDHRR